MKIPFRFKMELPKEERMALDNGLAALLGMITGVLSPIVVNAANYRIQNRRALSLGEKRRARLRGMLSGDKFKWRSIDALAASIGADEATTTELLIEIDARSSFSNPRSWALVSRAPWPDDLQPKE